MLPTAVPRLVGSLVVLRGFEDRDGPVVVEAGRDPVIPLITTVPTSGDEDDEDAAAAYLSRQRGRLAEGAGFSFAIAEGATDRAVGQIGLWTRELDAGRATVGYWALEHPEVPPLSWERVGDERRDMYSYARLREDHRPETG